MTPIPITPELVQAACHAAEPGLYDGSIANAMTPTLLLKPYTSATEVYVAARQRILTRQMTAALKAVARLTLSEPLPVVAHKGPHDSDAELFSNAAENIKGGRYPVGQNVRDAIARLIYREILRAQPLAAGGDDHE